jgi:putative intracellular protease/amidase
MLVAQIVFDRFTDLDVFLSWDLLNRVRHPNWTVKLLGAADHHTSAAGLTIPMHGRLEEAADADAVLFASGASTRELRFDRAWLERLKIDPSRQLVGSMCSGALLLHALGLLEGKRATTYPTVTEILRDAGVRVVDEPFVREGNVATAAACLAGIDLASWVIETLLGAEARDAALSEVQPVRAAAGVSNASATHRGSCLCGAIAYEVDGELGDFGYCHCKSCRKASGGPHGANAPVDRAKLKWVRGADRVREYESSPGKRRAFCPTCGSPLYAYLTTTRDVLRLRLGSLDTPFAKRPKAHTWVSDKADWEPLDEDMPRFAEWAPKDVLVMRGSRQKD